MVTTTDTALAPERKPFNTSMLVSIALLLAAAVLSLGTAFRWFDIRFRIGPYFVTHYLAVIGTFYIAGYTPLYYVVKRRRPLLMKRLIAAHMYGNLISFALISMHFAQQLTRPAQFPPDLGTGVALYIAMLGLVVSGFLHRYKIIPSLVPHWNRSLHISMTTAFYVVILVHILQGFGFL